MAQAQSLNPLPSVETLNFEYVLLVIALAIGLIVFKFAKDWKPPGAAERKPDTLAFVQVELKQEDRARLDSATVELRKVGDNLGRTADEVGSMKDEFRDMSRELTRHNAKMGQ